MLSRPFPLPYGHFHKDAESFFVSLPVLLTASNNQPFLSPVLLFLFSLSPATQSTAGHSVGEPVLFVVSSVLRLMIHNQKHLAGPVVPHWLLWRLSVYLLPAVECPLLVQAATTPFPYSSTNDLMNDKLPATVSLPSASSFPAPPPARKLFPISAATDYSLPVETVSAHPTDGLSSNPVV